MSEPDIHLYDDGTIFRFTFKENGAVLPIDLATKKIVKVEKKDKSLMQFDLEYWTNGSDGMAYWRTSGSDIDQKGKWKAEGYVRIPGWGGHTSTIEFEVGEILGDAIE